MRIKTITSVFVPLFLIPILILNGCTTSSDNASDKKTPEATQQQTMLSAYEAYDLAVTEATAKYGSVYLSEITAGGGTVGLSSFYQKVDDNGQAASWQVIFNQPATNETYLIILVYVENGEVARTYAGDPVEAWDNWGWDSFLKSFLVDIERCQVTGAEAVRIADENGGYDYTRIMLRLLNSSAGYHRWIVAYGPDTREKGQHPGITFRINCETGEIVGKSTHTYNVF